MIISVREENIKKLDLELLVKNNLFCSNQDHLFMLIVRILQAWITLDSSQPSFIDLGS